jgi:Ser/Thr protein kinase RdoA (MazF antagonist)
LGNLEKEYITSLPKLLVHGDYTLSNIGFTESGEPVYLDFDVAAVKPRVHDLAYAALTMLRCMQYSVGPVADSWGLVWHMVEEYERTAMMPLTRLERLAFPIEMARVSMCFAARAGFPSANERSWSELTRGLAEAECILRMVA